jgi:hypothetical protein
MKVCANCFSDKELKGFILTSTEIGDCIVCNSKSQPLLDLSELYDFFQELIDNFRLVDDGLNLISKIQGDWSFFSSNEVANKILNYVIPKINTEIISPDNLVEYSDDILANYGHWETLKDELKWKNRFIIDLKQLESLGWDGFFNTQYELKANMKFFRSRIHHISGSKKYKRKEMSCPLKEDSAGGRANPMGIPYLYLSEDKETTFYEVRSSYLDELSLGVFQLRKGISTAEIVDFTEYTPLYQPEYVKEAIQGNLLRDRISKDLSKPMRRYDSELEYIPTQFICEYIKVFTGAKGIRFRSSLHREGNNIVFFDPSLMECKAVKKVKIRATNLTAIDIV